MVFIGCFIILGDSNLQINFTNNEIWKILDAIKAYKKDYAVSVAVQKTFATIESKLKTCLESNAA